MNIFSNHLGSHHGSRTAVLGTVVRISVQSHAATVLRPIVLYSDGEAVMDGDTVPDLLGCSQSSR